MRNLFLIILFLLPLGLKAQRIEVYTDERDNKYIAYYSYGLPRDIVKTNAEMAASVNERGMVRRHHITKAVDAKIGDEGYDANRKLSFAFAVAPRNVNASGQEITDIWSSNLKWTEACGWDPATMDRQMGAIIPGDNQYGIGDGVSPTKMADSPTGCAAYQGYDGEDDPGDWRVPTQRELQTMFTVIEQALDMIEAGEVDVDVTPGEYWSSTEFYASGDVWYSWVSDNVKGTINANYDRSDKATYPVFVRCVKDLYFPANGPIPAGKKPAVEQDGGDCGCCD